MRSFTFILCLVVLFFNPALAQKKVALKVLPADAEIFQVIPGTPELKKLGVGSAIVEVEKKSETTIVLKKAGYADMTKVYTTLSEVKLPKEDALIMKDRQVTLKVLPEDAKIIADGNELEKGRNAIVVKEGEKVEVEIKRPGFVPVKKTYIYNVDEELPVTDKIQLTDRMIRIMTAPSDAQVVIDNQVVGNGFADVVVPFDKCVVVKVIKDGFVEVEKTYCNKEGLPELAMNDTFTLTDRTILVKALPEDAKIKIKDMVVGTGSYNVKIPKGECVEVVIEKEGYMTFRRSYCNQPNAPEFSILDAVNLSVDEAYTASEAADFVNINNVIEINPALQADAWKLMTQAIINVFDVIEITDKETGYLRTAWAVKRFANNTIRTRIILKIADSNNLKYTVKLSSEASGKAGSAAGDDSLFTEWNRVLDAYKYVVKDIQAKVK